MWGATLAPTSGPASPIRAITGLHLSLTHTHLFVSMNHRFPNNKYEPFFFLNTHLLSQTFQPPIQLPIKPSEGRGRVVGLLSQSPGGSTLEEFVGKLPAESGLEPGPGPPWRVWCESLAV